jgi:putative Holliday junction resolvase
MRYLAIDLGDKRTGIATGDATTRIASPVAVLDIPAAERQGQALMDAIVRTIADFWTPRDPGELVVGLPINMDGTDGPAAKKARRDAIAAAAILEGFLNNLSNPTSEAAPPPSSDGSSLR